MKKIPTVFKRNQENLKEIINEPHPDCLWVFAGEGVATRKYDGTCVKIEKGNYFKRREVRPGKKIPDSFFEEDFDKNTGKRFGWVPIDPELKENKWHMEAYNKNLPDGTYELVGPKIQGNPEAYDKHVLIRHSEAEIFDVPRTLEGIRNWIRDKDIEGIVFHHPDGRMGKVKKRDFGMVRKT